MTAAQKAAMDAGRRNAQKRRIANAVERVRVYLLWSAQGADPRRIPEVPSDRDFQLASLDEVVDWLLAQGFPDDWSTTIPAPAWLRDELAVRQGPDWGSTGAADANLRDIQAWTDDDPA